MTLTDYPDYPRGWESKPKKNDIWTLEDALNLIRTIQPKLRLLGYHVGLGGGVLNKGTSKHDLDLYVFPTSAVETEHPQQRERMLEEFKNHGVFELTRVFGPTSSGGGVNDAHCYYDLYQGQDANRKVDLFVVLTKEEMLMRYSPLDLSKPRLNDEDEPSFEFKEPPSKLARLLEEEMVGNKV